MRGSILIPIIVSSVAIGATLMMFQSGASPYITVEEARKLSGDRLNLGVDIDKKTLTTSIRSSQIEFEGVDRKGTRIKIKHIGPNVDLSQATRVTCVGKLEGDVFVSQQILVKCPSKYEEEQMAKERNGKA
jgi:cytochrome c-type biogenesis protein CcmE